MTTLPPRRMPREKRCADTPALERDCDSAAALYLGILERETSLELATLTLARLRSTN
jgi:hypothetical protein